ncbi:MAG: alpha/beta hydrolase domain-containing protein [Patescibacteria group bacterium]|nr:alpha/beta hydrolase domain-containing protein [Patescibacteria group bacterium]
MTYNEQSARVSSRVVQEAGFRIALALAVVAGLAASLCAEVVRLEIRQRAPFAGGHRFGAAGPYERISGRMYLEVDPADPANASIHDLKLAPRNERGMVECWTDFFLLAPADPQRGNRRILYDVHNRGNKLALWTFNGGDRTNDPSTMEHAGSGFLLHQGYSILWSGWNGEVMDDGQQRLLAGLPVATEDGQTITGPAHLEIATTEEVFSRAFSWSPWGISDAFPAVSLDNRQAKLTMRPSRDEPATEIPHAEWAFGKWEDGKLVPDPTHVYVKEGFRPGWLYDLVYTAKQPRVTGLGLASLRDCVSFFRYAQKDRDGVANPLAGAVERAYIFGISQSGRVINHLVYEGLNTDEARRPVFDGALLHVAGAGKGMFNYRFRMSTEYGTYHEGMLAGTEDFPLAPVSQTDPVTGETGNTLARARAAGHVPRMMFVQSSTEYWCRGASLLHTDVAGTTDLELPPEVRVYLVASSQHLGGGEHTPGVCQQPRNTLDDRGPVLRALLVALDKWVSDDVEPPASRYPRIDDGTLVRLEAFGKQFPRIPGVNLPEAYYQPARLDFGPRFHTEGIADVIPPKMGPSYQALVPAVDADGNDLAGIRLPDVAVPLGTYTGWNLRAAPFGAEGKLSRLDGMYLPFTRTAEEGTQLGDPRPTVCQRYPTRAAYLARMAEAALELQRQRFLLPDDVVAILDAAAARRLWDEP